MLMRPFAGQPDLGAMQDLLRATAGPFDPYPTADDLVETLIPAPETTVIWGAEELLGFAVLSDYDNLHYHFRPGALTAAVEAALMAWVADLARSRAARAGAAVTIQSYAREEDQARVALLERHGFAADADVVYTMHRELAGAIPPPMLPAGCELRPLGGAAEIPAYVAAHRAAYGTEYMTAEIRASILRAPGYRPQLDLVVAGPDGRIAAFCVCSIDAPQSARLGRQVGEVGILGSHPDWRGQGLGRAGLLAGLGALRAAGCDLATLGAGSWNAAAVGLYQSVGFAVAGRTRAYGRMFEARP